MAVDPTRMLNRSLTGLDFNPARCLDTYFTKQACWGTGLVADGPTMQQLVLSYIVPVLFAA